MMTDIMERDAGFCSGGDEDDMEAEDGIHSPTDASEDSVDVKVQAISLRNKNKRKCAEPRRVDIELPAKKRKIDISEVSDSKNDRDTISVDKTRSNSNSSPFRPWSRSPPPISRQGDGHQTIHLPLPLPSDFYLKNPFSPPGSISHFPLHISPDYRTVSKAESPSSRRFVIEDTSQRHRSCTVPSPLVPVARFPQDVAISSYPLPHTSPHFEAKPATLQEEPLSLVSKKKLVDSRQSLQENKSSLPECSKRNVKILLVDKTPPMQRTFSDCSPTWHKPAIDFRHPNSRFVTEVPKSHQYLKSDCESEVNRVTINRVKSPNEKTVKFQTESDRRLRVEDDNKFRIDSLLSPTVKQEPIVQKLETTKRNDNLRKPSQGNQQRNYKNMTRERRIEANARERTRVHTISAAFDTLRHSIPAYSHNQKLSKLSVLRIACSYIMTLSRLAGYDYSKDQSEPELSECVDNVSKTIQTEGKLRKKKDD